jgi:hypothetical protein
MARVGTCALLALASGAALVAACGEAGGDATEAPSIGGCSRVHLKWHPGDLLSRARRGLLLRGDRCVYLVRLRETRLVWRGRPGDSVRGLAWAPHAESFAVTTKRRRSGWRVVIVRRDGTILRRFPATGAAFLHDGRLVYSRRDAIYLSGGRRLASPADLERVAGFRFRGAIEVGDDPRGFQHGNGRKEAALTLWSRTGWKSVVLAVSTTGRVRRASPAFRAGGGEGVVSGWTWSPDGRKLFVTSEVVPPGWRGPGDHDHCLDSWSAGRGIRRVLCGSRLPRALRTHFARLVWSTDAGRALLDNGAIVTPKGSFAGRAEVPAWAFDLQWQPSGA